MLHLFVFADSQGALSIGLLKSRSCNLPATRHLKDVPLGPSAQCAQIKYHPLSLHGTPSISIQFFSAPGAPKAPPGAPKAPREAPPAPAAPAASAPSGGSGGSGGVPKPTRPTRPPAKVPKPKPLSPR